MTLKVSLTDLFICPISQERMKNPVVSTCGHTYEKIEIEGWVEKCLKENKSPQCPLCREPVNNFVANFILKQALDVLEANPNSLVDRVEDLTGEEREQVEIAMARVKERREVDKSKGIPDRLPEPMSFAKKIGEAISSIYKC